MSRQSRLPSHEHRGHKELRRCAHRAADAAEALRVSQLAQRVRCYTRGAALSGHQRARHAAPKYGVRQEQARRREISRQHRQRLPVYHPAPYGSVRSARDRLLPHGREHKETRRLRRGLQASGHHFRVRARRGAGCVPRSRPWHEW